MTDYIDRQAAIDALNGEITVTGKASAEAVRGYVFLVADRIKRLPPAEVEPVKRGRWIPGREISRDYMGDIITNIRYEDWRCSNCNCVSEDYRKPTWNYCPNCGAKMEPISASTENG